MGVAVGVAVNLAVELVAVLVAVFVATFWLPPFVTNGLSAAGFVAVVFASLVSDFVTVLFVAFFATFFAAFFATVFAAVFAAVFVAPTFFVGVGSDAASRAGLGETFVAVFLAAAFFVTVFFAAIGGNQRWTVGCPRSRADQSPTASQRESGRHAVDDVQGDGTRTIRAGDRSKRKAPCGAAGLLGKVIGVGAADAPKPATFVVKQACAAVSSRRPRNGHTRTDSGVVNEHRDVRCKRRATRGVGDGGQQNRRDLWASRTKAGALLKSGADRGLHCVRVERELLRRRDTEQHAAIGAEFEMCCQDGGGVTCVVCLDVDTKFVRASAEKSRKVGGTQANQRHTEGVEHLNGCGEIENRLRTRGDNEGCGVSNRVKVG